METINTDYLRGYNQAVRDIANKVKNIYSDGHMARIIEREFLLQKEKKHA